MPSSMLEVFKDLLEISKESPKEGSKSLYDTENKTDLKIGPFRLELAEYSLCWVQSGWFPSH